MKNILGLFSELFSAKYCNRVVLEDKTVNEIKDIAHINGTEYVYLSNIKDEQDFCIRKIIAEKGKSFICGLEDD